MRVNYKGDDYLPRTVTLNACVAVGFDVQSHWPAGIAGEARTPPETFTPSVSLLARCWVQRVFGEAVFTPHRHVWLERWEGLHG